MRVWYHVPFIHGTKGGKTLSASIGWKENTHEDQFAILQEMCINALHSFSSAVRSNCFVSQLLVYVFSLQLPTYTSVPCQSHGLRGWDRVCNGEWCAALPRPKASKWRRCRQSSKILQRQSTPSASVRWRGTLFCEASCYSHNEPAVYAKVRCGVIYFNAI